MTDRLDELQPELAAWLTDGPDRGPSEGLAAALAATRTVRQRPAWLVPSWWALPSIGGWAARAVLVAGAILLVAALLVVGLVLFVGSLQQTRLPIGPFSNGRIVYDTGPGGGVFVTDRDGANPVRIGAEGIERSPAYSPDGTMIGFWSRPLDDPHSTEGRLPVTFGLYVADADGSHVRWIAGSTRFSINPYYPVAWSPRSDRVAFAAESESGFDLWTADVDGSPPRPLVTASTTEFGPVWSPDGQWIAYTEEDDASHAIVVIRPNGSERRVIHQQPIIGSTDVDAAFGGALAWAPDSRRLVYSRGQDLARPEEPPHAMFLVIASIDGTEQTIAVDPGGAITFPAWSPDGSRIAYLLGESPVEGRVVEVAGRDAATVTMGRCTAEGGVTSFGWTPDAHWIVFGCASEPALRAADGSGATSSLVMPPDAAAIDVQRVAP